MRESMPMQTHKPTQCALCNAEECTPAKPVCDACKPHVEFVHPAPEWASAPNPRLPGRYIVKLMRAHKVTIRTLANSMQITMKRVRDVRANGVSGRCMCLDWYESITNTGLLRKA